MATQPGKEAKPADEASNIKKESVVVSSLPQPTPLKAPTEKKEPLPPSSSTSEIVKEVETKSKDSEGKGKTRMERKGEEKEGPTESKKSVKEVKFRSGEDMEDEERSLEPLFEDQKKFLKDDRDYLKVGGDQHLKLLFRSIDVDLGSTESVILSSEVMIIDHDPQNPVFLAVAKPQESEVSKTGGQSHAKGKLAEKEEEQEKKAAGFQNNLGERGAAVVVTQYAVYIFPPAMEVDGKQFLVYNVYERFILQDLVLISRPYRQRMSQDGEEYALRSQEVVLHFKNNKHLWLRVLNKRDSAFAETVNHQFLKLTGMNLEFSSSSCRNLVNAIKDGTIKDTVDDTRIDWWGSHDLSMQGWLWHFYYDRERGEIPGSNLPKKIKWKRRWFSLSKDNLLMYFDSPEQMAGFRAKAASMNLLSFAKRKEVRDLFNSNHIDLMDVDLRNMPIEQDPGGFEIMVDSSWQLGLPTGPITHHLLLPLNQVELSRSRRPSSLRNMFPSIDGVFRRNRSDYAENRLSWVHAVFERVQVAQYGLSRAKQMAKAYTSTFYIKSKRTLNPMGSAVGYPPPPPGSPPKGVRARLASFDLTKPGSFSLMKVTVPEGKGFKEGNRLFFVTPNDTTMMVTIPPGVSEGEDFVVKVPKQSLIDESEEKIKLESDKITAEIGTTDDKKNDTEEEDEEPAVVALDEFLRDVDSEPETKLTENVDSTSAVASTRAEPVKEKSEVEAKEKTKKDDKVVVTEAKTVENTEAA
ncbi:hypothetical protein AAMO2058_000750900 [Amorphochlora amoebiformis]